MSPVEQLKASGLRTTKPRVAVLAALHDSGHLTADEVRERVLDQIGSVSVQAVYDVLQTLTDHKVIRKLQLVGSPAYYEIENGDNHHHLVCAKCGQIADIECPVGEIPCITIPKNGHGFEVFTAEVTWRGICPNCNSK